MAPRRKFQVAKLHNGTGQLIAQPNLAMSVPVPAISSFWAPRKAAPSQAGSDGDITPPVLAPDTSVTPPDASQPSGTESADSVDIVDDSDGQGADRGAIGDGVPATAAVIVAPRGDPTTPPQPASNSIQDAQKVTRPRSHLISYVNCIGVAEKLSKDFGAGLTDFMVAVRVNGSDRGLLQCKCGAQGT